MTKKTSTERPKIEADSSGDGNRATAAYSGRLAMPGDRILASRGGGDLRIYEEIASDPKVKSAFEQRRNAVIAKEWRVEAGGNRRIDKRAADHFEAQLRHVGFDRVTDKMLWGVWYGFSPAEILWEVRDGLLAWKDIKVRHRRKFRFDGGGELRRFSREDPINGVPALPPYFWHFATGADNDDEPYGLGLAHFCYWYVLFKRQGLGFWLRFLEKFAGPTVIGEFPPGATDAEKNILLAAGRAISMDTTVLVPQGMPMKFLEASRSGTADYKVLHDTMNQAIEQVIIGQTAGSSGTPGRLGGDDLQGDVRLDIIKADADLVCESLNLGPARWLTEHNFAGAAVPRVYRVIEEADDADTLAERDTKVMALGYAPSLEYVQETYGKHWQPKAAPQEPAAGDDLEAPSFSEAQAVTIRRVDAQERLDAILAGADAKAADWRDFMEPRINELLRLLDEGGDLKDFRERVIEFADADPDDRLVKALARGGFAAQLLGRLPKGG